MLVLVVLLLSACSEKTPVAPPAIEPRAPALSAAVSLSCPSGWTEDGRGAAVLRCKRTRLGLSPDYLIFVNLKARGHVDPILNAAPATRENGSPLFAKATMPEMWNAGKTTSGAFCTVASPFFMDKSSDATRISFPERFNGVLRSTGSALTQAGARIASIRPEEGWIAWLGLATTNYDQVNSTLNEPTMFVGLPVTDGILTAPEQRSYVGVKDVDNDGFAETIFFFVSSWATEHEAYQLVQAANYRSIMSMDGGGSAQLNCGGKTLAGGDGRKLPQVFLVADAPARTAIARSYRNSAPDHLYGTTAGEGAAYGYVLESGQYFWLESTGGGVGAVPVYRCLWGGSRHLVTLSASCEGSGKQEGVLGYAVTQRLTGTTPLYRLYNPRTGDHLYTTSDTERRNVLAAGWSNEGITAYVWTTG
jgi:hypothetical protein